MSRRRSPLLHLFFALLLVFAQQQALLHALGHGVDQVHATSQDPVNGHEAFCAKCLAVAHLDHVDGVAVVPLAPASYTPPTFASIRFEAAPASFVDAYLSRAPPVFS